MKVEIVRGNSLESIHEVVAIAMSYDGKDLFSSGDVSASVFPRSSIKMLQALPLVHHTLCSGQRLSAQELALACASHAGETEHLAVVEPWLKRLGLGAQDLLCGTHWPYDQEATRALLKADRQPSTLHNNCSGKHTGFLNLAQLLGAPTADYLCWDHPAQIEVRRFLSSISEEDFDQIPWGIDGCGVPNYFAPMRLYVKALARFAQRSLNEGIERQVYQAFRANPMLTSGRTQSAYELL